jgi:hypothetical protein
MQGEVWNEDCNTCGTSHASLLLVYCNSDYFYSLLPMYMCSSPDLAYTNGAMS